MKLLYIVTYLLVAVGSIVSSGTPYIASYNPDDKISAKRAIEAAGGRIVTEMDFLDSWVVAFDQQASKGVMSTADVLALVDLHESITAIEVDYPREIQQAFNPIGSIVPPPGDLDKRQAEPHGNKLLQVDQVQKACDKVEPRVKPPSFLSQQQAVPYGIKLVQADLVKSNPNSPKKVCIIDSGISIKHPDLCGRADNCTSRITSTSLRSYSSFTSTYGGLFDPFEDTYGQGTHVAGTIAALNNGQGVVGASGNGVKLHIVKIFGKDGDFQLKVSNLILAAFACASSGVDIISMSFSGTKPSKLEERLFSTLRTQYNILTVASAGSSGTSEKKYPASYPSILSVGAVARNSTVASFSQRNNQVDLVAPGVDVLSTAPVGTTRFPAPNSVCTLKVGNATIDCKGMMARLPGVVYNRPSAFTKPEGIKAAVFNCGKQEAGSICKGATGKICLIEHSGSNYQKILQVCIASKAVAAILFGPEKFVLPESGGNAIPSVGITRCEGVKLRALTQKASIQATLTLTRAPAQYSGYGLSSGTSMAVPHVAGVAALVWSNCRPLITATQIRQALINSAKDLGDAGYDTSYGHGLVQAKAALSYLALRGLTV